MRTTHRFPEGLKITNHGEPTMKVTSQILKDYALCDDVTLDTAHRNQLKEQLNNLHYEL